MSDGQVLTFGDMDPNSEHQRWSRWVYGIQADPNKLPPLDDCVHNARKYFAQVFKTVGRARCDIQGSYYVFVVEVEGPPAHDPEYVRAANHHFKDQFMRKGFGDSARLVKFNVSLMAGSREDGSPPEQWLVMPWLDTTAELFTPRKK